MDRETITRILNEIDGPSPPLESRYQTDEGKKETFRRTEDEYEHEYDRGWEEEEEEEEEWGMHYSFKRRESKMTKAGEREGPG